MQFFEVTESRFFRIDKSVTSRLRVERSEFIGEVLPVSGNAEVDTAIRHARKRYPNARHQPYAYRIAASGHTIEYCSDDGEPPGTAGRSIQERLQELNLVNTLLIVTRYFGGRKLGTRRLRHAFSESAGMTLDAASLIEVFPVRSVVVNFPFDMTGTVNSIIQKAGGIIEGQQYDEGVRLEILFRREIISKAIRHLSEVIKDQGGINLIEGERLVDA